MLHAPGAVTGHPRHRSWLAAFLSFVLPGLGQAYAGRRRLGLLLAAPVVVVVLAGVALAVGVGAGAANDLLSRGFLLGVLIVNVALLGWRAFAIADAGLAADDGGRERRRAVVAVVMLLALTVGMHAWLGSVVARLDVTLGQVFSSGGGGAPLEAVPATEGASPGPADPATGPVYRWDGEERINVLLVGTDAAPGREAELTDVLLVVSIDPADGTAVMVSVPRDTGYVPLPDTSVHPDGLFPGKVNELAPRAALDPATWCPDLVHDPAACGLRTLQDSIGLYLGMELHHYALVDMAGFAELIDAVGGVELCLPGRLVDPNFSGTLSTTQHGGELVLPAGCTRYDGLDALAYARSRQGWIEMPDGTLAPQNDFERNERQQRMLLALRRELADTDPIFELPAVLSAIGRTVTTDVPRGRAGDLASLLPLITAPDIERVVLGYPDFVDLPVDSGGNYLLVPRREVIRQEMARIFGADELAGWYLGSTAPGPPATESAP